MPAVIQTLCSVSCLKLVLHSEKRCHANIHAKFHANVFVQGARPSISGYQVDTISSCNYSSYASELLSTFNPQESEAPEPPQPKKRFRPVPLTYATAAASSTSQKEQVPATATASVSYLSSNDMDKLYEEMSKRISATHGDITALNINELEQKVRQTSTDIQAVKQNLEQSIQGISNSVEQLTTKVDKQHQDLHTTVQALKNTIERQNLVILGIQQEFKENMTLLTDWTVRDFYTLIDFSAYVEPIQNCAIFTLPLRFCFGNLDICYMS
jgi:hypothetical protein